MIIGVMSDTHGNLPLMHEVAQQMLHVHQVELIYHLGDDYRDGQVLGRAGCPVRIIPGLWCSEYTRGDIPKRLLNTEEGVSIAAAHAEKDLRRVEQAADIILIGHTHIARIESMNGHLYVNPGHLQGEISREQLASYAILTISEKSIHAEIYGVNCKLRFEGVFPRKEDKTAVSPMQTGFWGDVLGSCLDVTGWVIGAFFHSH